MRKAWILTLALAGIGADAATVNCYFIGNSMTWDGHPPSIELLATQGAGTLIDTGYHIQYGQPLNWHLKHPWASDEPAVAEYGLWPDAVNLASTNSIDFFSYQPYFNTDGFGVESTAGTDTQVIGSWMNMNGPTPQVILWQCPAYTADGATYSDAWNQAFSGLDTPMKRCKAFFDLLETELKKLRPGLVVIPVGDLMMDLDASIPGGAFAWYRDASHLDTEGRYVAGVAAYTVITGQDPTLLPDSAPVGSIYEGISAGDAAMVQTAVKARCYTP